MRYESTGRIETVVIGGGQAGLSVGHHLARLGREFVILDAGARVGQAWRDRWDSLRLFTPARYDGLDGMPFPADPWYFPTKDEMADYLEGYAARFRLPVRTGARVERVTRAEDGFRVSTGTGSYQARNVVVAMSSYQRPRVPAFASALNPDVVQIHSRDYRNPGQLQDGNVLIVGAGNSGAEIAMDLAPRHRVLLSGRDVGALPFRVDSLHGRFIFAPLVLRGLFHRVLTVRTPLGRRARPDVLAHSGPLIRTKSPHLRAAGVRRVPRTTGVEDGLPKLEDGRVVEVANVVWCTGFEPGFRSWIDLPIHEDGIPEPRHRSGSVPDVPGLFFVGLAFLHALSSVMIHGVGRDAERIARAVARRNDARKGARDAAVEDGTAAGAAGRPGNARPVAPAARSA